MEQNGNVSLVKPGVVTWFYVYCWILCIMYFVVMFASIIFFVVDPAKLEMAALDARITGFIMLVMGGVLFIAGILPLILQPRPWLWVYDLIVICIGLTSCCFWPICIPLIIFWIKPETKQYFGRL
jgi:hypothetical protein